MKLQTPMLRSLIVVFLLALTTFIGSNVAKAEDVLTMRLGPPGAGNGGPNPMSIPPGVPDIEVTWLTSRNFEVNVALVPGLLFGQRWKGPEGIYVSGGGGLVINANGVGLGGYTGFGYEAGTGRIRFNAEFKQALGIAGGGLISPYALRIGAGMAL